MMETPGAEVPSKLAIALRHSGAHRRAEPGIHKHHCCDVGETVQYGIFGGYGFRARRYAAPRKDGESMQPYDLVIRGGTVATATDSFKADVGIRGAKIAATAEGLDKAKREFDARGSLVRPGGGGSHSHIEQLSAS